MKCPVCHKSLTRDVREMGYAEAIESHQRGHELKVIEAARDLPSDIGRPDAWKRVAKVRLMLRELDDFVNVKYDLEAEP